MGVDKRPNFRRFVAIYSRDIYRDCNCRDCYRILWLDLTYRVTERRRQLLLSIKGVKSRELWYLEKYLDLIVLIIALNNAKDSYCRVVIAFGVL